MPSACPDCVTRPSQVHQMSPVTSPCTFCPFVYLFCPSACLAPSRSLLMKRVPNRNGKPTELGGISLANEQAIQNADKHALDTVCYTDNKFIEHESLTGRFLSESDRVPKNSRRAWFMSNSHSVLLFMSEPETNAVLSRRAMLCHAVTACLRQINLRCSAHLENDCQKVLFISRALTLSNPSRVQTHLTLKVQFV